MTTLDLDPDLWLYSRLALGRGRQRAAAVGLGTIVVAGIAFGYIPAPFAPTTLFWGAGTTLPLALLVLLMAPTRAVSRLFDLERDGLLDLTRLCGRPPVRTLAAFLLGSAGPWIVAAAVLVASHQRLHHGTGAIWLATLAFSSSLVLALAAYGTLPAALAPDSRFLKPLLIAVAILTLVLFNYANWVRADHVDPRERTVTLLFLATLAPAASLARRRLVRPRAGTLHTVDIAALLGRALPRSGPPEFMRQLRCTTLSGGTIATIVLAPPAVFLLARSGTLGRQSFLLNAAPAVILFIGSFAASMTIRREIDSGTIDFVRLTPQSAETVVLSWYGALSLPFWVGAVLAVATLEAASPVTVVSYGVLLAAALMMPALCVAEGFQGRRAGTYLFVPVFVAALMLTYADAQVKQMEGWVTITPLPWNIDRGFVLPALVTVVALSVGAGRLRRALGPALVGVAAAVAAMCAGLLVRAWIMPSYTFPRSVVATMALLASLAAEERATPSAPWSRVSIAGGGALVGVAALTAQAGFDARVTTMTAIAAALATGTGLLAHELLWRTSLLSLGVRFAVCLAILRPWLDYVAARLGGVSAWIPAQLQIVDLAGLAAAFAVLAVAHARRRLTS